MDGPLRDAYLARIGAARPPRADPATLRAAIHRAATGRPARESPATGAGSPAAGPARPIASAFEVCRAV